MKTLGAITDPQYQPRTHYTAYERFWLKWIRDERDLPFIHLLTRIHLILFPWVIIMYTPLLKGWYWWLAYIPYAYIAQSYFKGRFGLMFHCICHRPLFKKPYKWMHQYITWFVAPLFGNTPETYFAHHILMHHVENNMEEDASSTLKYQRDNFLDFLRYFFHFILMGFVDTFRYLFPRQRKKVYLRFGFGEIMFFVFCIGMSFVNFKATLMFFIIPMIYARFIMMMGNWTQHSFIDKNDPEGHFSSVFNCINNSYNQNCWNDGYHSIHHFNPGLHYTEIPGVFLKNKENFIRNKTFIFDGIHYLHIFAWLMTKRYDLLSQHIVNIDNTFSSQQEVMDLMRQRVQKIA